MTPTSVTALLPSSGAPARPASASLVVTGQAVYLSPDADAPAVVPLCFARPLLSAEQPYVRRLTVGPEWQALDLGWLAESAAGISYLALASDAPTFAVNPTAEERAAAMARVVEVYLAPPPPADAGTRSMFSPKLPSREPFAALLVGPGEQTVLTPGPGVTVMVRCRGGVARCTLTLFPG